MYPWPVIQTGDLCSDRTDRRVDRAGGSGGGSRCYGGILTVQPWGWQRPMGRNSTHLYVQSLWACNLSNRSLIDQTQSVKEDSMFVLTRLLSLRL